MRTDVLNSLTDEELEAYARSMGLTLRAFAGKADKVDFIQRRRGRAVDLTVFGVGLSVEVRRFRSTNFSDVMENAKRTPEELYGAFRGLLGDEQFDALMGACTDEDGEVDGDAVAVAFTRLLTCEELKNY